MPISENLFLDYYKRVDIFPHSSNWSNVLILLLYLYSIHCVLTAVRVLQPGEQPGAWPQGSPYLDRPKNLNHCTSTAANSLARFRPRTPCHHIWTGHPGRCPDRVATGVPTGLLPVHCNHVSHSTWGRPYTESMKSLKWYCIRYNWRRMETRIN